MRRISIVNNDFYFSRIAGALAATLKPVDAAVFEKALNSFFNTKHCFFTSCGFTALYVILKTLMTLKPGRNEVIIPAYTAPGLTLPIRKLGLKVRLCDISLKTFNLDPSALANVISKDTLAVVAPNMFGLPVDLNAVGSAAGKDIFVIEDIAQSMGTSVGGAMTGGLSEFGFGSFGRGKNFSLYHGGFLTLASGEHYDLVKRYFDELPATGLLPQYKAAVMFTTFSLLVQPGIYPAFHNLLASVKPKSEQADFFAAKMGGIQVSIGARLFGTWKMNYEKRILNGVRYFELLKNIKGIALPQDATDNKTAFNRFPLLIEDETTKIRILHELGINGIDASLLYLKPVHMLWDLGYKQNDLPNAEYLAAHLLTLPAHGMVSDADKVKIVSIIDKVLNGAPK